MGPPRRLRQLTRWLLVVILAVGLMGCAPGGSDVVDTTPGTDMSKVQVTISIDDAHLEQMDQVADQLKAAGLDIEKTMSTLGIVTGSVDSDKMSSLSDIAGVDSVEVDQTITLPTPGSDVQ